MHDMCLLFTAQTLTGQILEAVSAASFPLPIGDVETDGHRPTDGQVAVGGDSHAQQTLAGGRGVNVRLEEIPQRLFMSNTT